ncbi:hypothetical protein PENTCL1PPCAC_9450, partial [Pristionchus entomophagus]
MIQNSARLNYLPTVARAQWSSPEGEMDAHPSHIMRATRARMTMTRSRQAMRMQPLLPMQRHVLRLQVQLQQSPCSSAGAGVAGTSAAGSSSIGGIAE